MGYSFDFSRQCWVQNAFCTVNSLTHIPQLNTQLWSNDNIHGSLHQEKAVSTLPVLEIPDATYTRTEKVALVTNLSQLKNPRKVV